MADQPGADREGKVPLPGRPPLPAGLSPRVPGLPPRPPLMARPDAGSGPSGPRAIRPPAAMRTPGLPPRPGLPARLSDTGKLAAPALDAAPTKQELESRYRQDLILVYVREVLAGIEGQDIMAIYKIVAEERAYQMAELKLLNQRVEFLRSGAPNLLTPAEVIDLLRRGEQGGESLNELIAYLTTLSKQIVARRT